MIGNIVANRSQQIRNIGASVSGTGLVHGTDNLQKKKTLSIYLG